MTESRQSTRRLIICLILAALIVVAGVFVWAEHAARKSMAEQTDSIRETIYKRALQCYVIEGAYPESLEYLVDNYGLAVNTDEYRILYLPYAENQPPDIRVIYTGNKE